VPVSTSGQSYTPFGLPQSGALPAPFGFTGELHREGLVYLRARWYDPVSGTFTSVDPFDGFERKPYSLHPYQYGYSNPVRWTDPSGLCPDCINIRVGIDDKTRTPGGDAEFPDSWFEGTVHDIPCGDTITLYLRDKGVIEGMGFSGGAGRLEASITFSEKVWNLLVFQYGEFVAESAGATSDNWKATVNYYIGTFNGWTNYGTQPDKWEIEKYQGGSTYTALGAGMGIVSGTYTSFTTDDDNIQGSVFTLSIGPGKAFVEWRDFAGGGSKGFGNSSEPFPVIGRDLAPGDFPTRGEALHFAGSLLASDLSPPILYRPAAILAVLHNGQQWERLRRFLAGDTSPRFFW
jgi:RHS repeat-associated protein